MNEENIVVTRTHILRLSTLQVLLMTSKLVGRYQKKTIHLNGYK